MAFIPCPYCDAAPRKSDYAEHIRKCARLQDRIDKASRVLAKQLISDFGEAQNDAPAMPLTVQIRVVATAIAEVVRKFQGGLQ